MNADENRETFNRKTWDAGGFLAVRGSAFSAFIGVHRRFHSIFALQHRAAEVAYNARLFLFRIK
jgi:hypothetical protein